MADYRTISTKLWTSPYIETLVPDEKLLYIYLFSCPHTNNAGILHISPRKMSFETGITDVGRILDKLKRTGKVVEVDGYFWVVNFIDHQTSNSPKITQSIGKALEAAPRKLADMVLTRYSNLSIPYTYHTDTVSIHYGEREEEGEVEGEREEEGELLSTERGAQARAGGSGKRFTSPSKKDVADFFHEHGSTVEEAGKFWYHFDASGWTLGNGRKMKSWQSAAHKWIINSKTKYANGNGTQTQRRNGTLADQQPIDDAAAIRIVERIAADPRYA
jgi:hypothetical protein